MAASDYTRRQNWSVGYDYNEPSGKSGKRFFKPMSDEEEQALARTDYEGGSFWCPGCNGHYGVKYGKFGKLGNFGDEGHVCKWCARDAVNFIQLK